MDLRDLTVEVRDVNLRRLGQIEPEYLTARLEPAYVAPGKWSLSLPSEHPMAEVLERPGSGIIVTHTDPAIGTLLTGPRTEPDRTASVADPRGTTVFTGTSDTVVLWNRLAYPTPLSPLSAQTNAYDVVTNLDGETAMRRYVDRNAGAQALTGRRVVSLEAVNAHRGELVTKSARFDNLGDLLASIAVVSGLGFRVVQVGDHLEFQTLTIRDRRKLIRLDLSNGTLASQNAKTRAPSATAMVVAGQGEGAERTILEKVNDSAEVQAYGLFSRVEVFKDQRNTDDLLELEQAADEGLAEGAPSAAITVVPGDDTTMAYPRDWGLGDTITVVVDDTETHSQVTGAVILVNKDVGVRIGASIGDVQGWDPQAGLRKTVADQDRRLSSLERNAEAAAALEIPDLRPRYKRVEFAAATGIGQTATDLGVTVVTNPFLDRSCLVTLTANCAIGMTTSGAQPALIAIIAENTTARAPLGRYEDRAAEVSGPTHRQAITTAVIAPGQQVQVYGALLNRSTSGTVTCAAAWNTDYLTVRMDPVVTF